MWNSLLGTTTPNPAELLNVYRKSVTGNIVNLPRFPAQTKAAVRV
jgi:hypothetical protein